MTHVSGGQGQVDDVGRSAPVLVDVDASAVSALLKPLRRFVLSLVSDPHDADDVVQDTVSRVLKVQDRLDEASLTGYAFAVARNLVHDLHRKTARERRHLPKMVEDQEPEQPESVVVALEERRALRSALEQLPPALRDLVLAHDLHGHPLAEVSGERTPAALAAQLARARARARLDYVLALRRVDLPEARCRPVLLALSMGDQRRQRELRAGRHVMHCDTCNDLAPVLVRRERALAGVLPWFTGGAALAWLATVARRRPVQVGSVAGVAGVAVLVATMTATGSTAPAAEGTPRAQGTRAVLTVADRPLLPRRNQLDRITGEAVLARGVPVLSVPADEGFWVGRANRRVWVQLRGKAESAQHVRHGDRVFFRGRVVAQGPGFADRVGVSAREGSGELTSQGYHVEVFRADLSVAR